MNQDQVKDVFQKGIILGPTINKDRYICPVTGAHFEFEDMCRRMNNMAKKRMVEYRESGQGSGSIMSGKHLNKELKNQAAIQALLQKQQQEAATRKSHGDTYFIPQHQPQALQQQQKAGAAPGPGQMGQVPPGNVHNRQNSQNYNQAMGVGHTVTQEDEVITNQPTMKQQKTSKMNVSMREFMSFICQNQAQMMSSGQFSGNGIKKTKEISSALYSTKVGNMIKMKSHHNARNGGQDLRKFMGGAGTFQNGQQAFHQNMGATHGQVNLTEGDDLMMGGAMQAMGASFDHREKVKEIKQRHLAAQMPARNIQIKKSSNTNTKNGTTLKVMSIPHSGQPQISGVKSSNPSMQQAHQAQDSAFQNVHIGMNTQGKNTSMMNNRGNLPTNFSMLHQHSNFHQQQDNAYSSQEDSLDRKSHGNVGKRILSQPEHATSDHRREPSQESSAGTSNANHLNLFDAENQRKFAAIHSKTQQPGTHANPSKRLSQKSSARQFQVQAQIAGLSPQRKLQNLPVHVQQQIIRGLQQSQNMQSPDQQLLFRPADESRNNQANFKATSYQNKSVSNQGLRSSFQGPGIHQRNLSHAADGQQIMPMVHQNTSFQQQASLSKTGMGFQQQQQQRKAQNPQANFQKTLSGGANLQFSPQQQAPGKLPANIGNNLQNAQHRRQFSNHIQGQKMTSLQSQNPGQKTGNVRNLVGQLYDKRGRNQKGQLVPFQQTGASNTGNIPEINGVPHHNRNKTQIISGLDTGSGSIL